LWRLAPEELACGDPSLNKEKAAIQGLLAAFLIVKEIVAVAAPAWKGL